MAEMQEDFFDNTALPEDEEQGMFEHYRFDIAAGQEAVRVDKWLSTHMEYTSRHRIQLAIKSEYIRVNDTPATGKKSSDFKICSILSASSTTVSYCCRDMDTLSIFFPLKLI